MTDKNHNGVIDKDAGEGYGEFNARYGDADTGFAANGVTYGAANGRLEEPEIVNHYYIVTIQSPPKNRIFTKRRCQKMFDIPKKPMIVSGAGSGKPLTHSAGPN
jgi:hypothetical protein